MSLTKSSDNYRAHMDEVFMEHAESDVSDQLHAEWRDKPAPLMNHDTFTVINEHHQKWVGEEDTDDKFEVVLAEKNFLNAQNALLRTYLTHKQTPTT